MDILFRPIHHWPGTTTQERHRSRFRSSYHATLKILDRELIHLQATDIVIQLALRPADIRMDGLPRAGAKPDHPGVILAFNSKHGPLSYPCDAFDGWEDNLHAIALSLNHLRAVDRYGVTKRGEQYRGWEQLPPPSNGHMTVTEANRFLGKCSGVDTIRTRAELAEAYRCAAFAMHPDRGGSEEEFKKVVQAKEILDAMFDQLERS